MDYFSFLVIIGFILLMVWIYDQKDKEPPTSYTIPGLSATVPGFKVWELKK